MKVQISRLSSHQNGKVIAIIMAVGSLFFVLPFVLMVTLAAPADKGPPLIVWVIAVPIFYLIIGYITVAVGCWFYNLMFKHIGGIEFESNAGVLHRQIPEQQA